MDCRECESILEAYALGELTESEQLACRAHVETCSACRQALQAYTCVLNAITAEPLPTPSQTESAALAEALAHVELCPRTDRRGLESVPRGFPGFVLASVLTFVVIATVLALQRFGVVSIVALAGSIGLQWLALMAVVIVFVTSFIPIAVTAHRRPLNGMTFRR